MRSTPLDPNGAAVVWLMHPVCAARSQELRRQAKEMAGDITSLKAVISAVEAGDLKGFMAIADGGRADGLALGREAEVSSMS